MDVVLGSALGSDRRIILNTLTEWIATVVGRPPRDLALYQRALTHGSHSATSYQRLEFLGDRVLGLSIARWLYAAYPDEPEGQMSRRFNALVTGPVCAEVARAIGVGPHLRLGKQARDDGGSESENILGDVTEALIGALYLDHGMEAAEAFVRKHWRALVEGHAKAPSHPKSALQEWAAANNRRTPAYTLLDRSGPHHAPLFTVSVSVGTGTETEATGSRNRRCGGIAGETEVTQRCGIVAVVGAPNAGKSTLVNALVGQKVAIVSPKAQTTRTRLMGVALADETQIVLVDTPGIFAANRRFDRAMVQAAWGGAADADLIALVIDAKAGLGAKVEAILTGLGNRPEPKLLVLNKVDIADKAKLLRHAQALNERLTFTDTLMVSAATGDGIADLKARFATAMPEGPWHFPADQVSDATDRIMAAEVTREQIFLQLYQELPQACAVETEKYEERSDGTVEIHQQILVARASQRAIVLGKGGTRLKEIGSNARAELAAMLGVKVHLYLHVKVAPDWAEDRSVYRDIGLDWVD
jgi:GTPase